MEAKIGKLKAHFILCGYGKVGQEIANIFKEEGVPFVILDINPERIARAEQAGYLCLLGDATSDEVLKEAGIEQAQGLVSAVGNDVDNTYISLSARQLRSDLFIEARASTEEAGKKLKRAGADRIILPYRIGARRMAMLALRPAVIDFIDTVIYRHGRELQMENVAVASNSLLVGLTVEEASHRSRATILAIGREDGKLLANPAREEIIKGKDQLIVMGTKKQLSTLEKICARC